MIIIIGTAIVLLAVIMVVASLLSGGNKPYIANPGRHGIGDTEGMGDAAIIEQWQRCRIPGCRDCAKTAFTPRTAS